MIYSHPLERKFNAPVEDILEAIEHGFRAQVDIRGKLAELYLYRHLEQLRKDGCQIVSILWHDADGQPDFEIMIEGGPKLRLECKNLRSDKSFSAGRGCKVEIQKTRGGLDKEGRKTRGYQAIILTCWQRARSTKRVNGGFASSQRIDLRGAKTTCESLRLCSRYP